MSNLEKYVEYIKEYKNNNKSLTQRELIRYIYIDLGKRLSFSTNFTFPDRSKKETRKSMYKESSSEKSLDNAMETGDAICKSMSYIFKYVCNKLGIEAEVVTDYDDPAKDYRHTYNLVKEEDGTEYIVDLQSDIKYIKSRARTYKYGLNKNDFFENVISRFDLEQIDKKIGYISDKDYYTDEYEDFMKLNLSDIKDFYKRVEIFLENINVFENDNMKYVDRCAKHYELIQKIFSLSEKNKINMVDCWEEKDGKKNYINCIAVSHKETSDIYLYSEEEKRYIKYDIKDFARMIDNGLNHKQNIWGLRNAFKELYNEDKNIEV